jgi:CubicO group peptidase (beta-lactamase class C family)
MRTMIGLGIVGAAFLVVAFTIWLAARNWSPDVRSQWQQLLSAASLLSGPNARDTSNEGAFEARGIFGQHVYMNPKENVVVVV